MKGIEIKTWKKNVLLILLEIIIEFDSGANYVNGVIQIFELHQIFFFQKPIEENTTRLWKIWLSQGQHPIIWLSLGFEPLLQNLYSTSGHKHTEDLSKILLSKQTFILVLKG